MGTDPAPDAEDTSVDDAATDDTVVDDATDDEVRDRLIEGTTTASDDESAPADAIHELPAGVTHPARKGGRVTDIPAVAAR